ncbi:MAG: type I methionyl aminopeptidase [Patescibacteria group bacterium]
MISIKTKNEIKIMQEGGRILAKVLNELLKNIKPGVTELEIDNLAEKLILKNGAKPGFKEVKGYNNSICVSTNNVVVHGVPTNYKFKSEDVVGIDCGVFYKGFHTDMAETLRVKSQISNLKSQMVDEIDKFLETGKRALGEAIKEARVGNRVGHVSKTIQNIVEGEGYSIVRSLVGHGVGRTLHEEPEVPGFLGVDIKETPILKEGMSIAIEVIYNMGKSNVKYLNEDGWTIATEDGSISGLFERTIAITKNGPVILTV